MLKLFAISRVINLKAMEFYYCLFTPFFVGDLAIDVTNYYLVGLHNHRKTNDVEKLDELKEKKGARNIF